MIPSGIEPATFRIVAQWLNQLCHQQRAHAVRYLLMWHRLLEDSRHFYEPRWWLTYIPILGRTKQIWKVCNNSAYEIPSFVCLWIFFNLRQVGFSVGNYGWKYEKRLYIDRFRRWYQGRDRRTASKKVFVDAFAKLRKAAICQSFLRHETICLPLDGFSWNLIYLFFENMPRKFHVSFMTLARLTVT